MCNSARQGTYLAHLLLASLTKEGVCLVNEEQQASAAALSPVKHVMQLSDSLTPQGGHIAPTHDGVVQA